MKKNSIFTILLCFIYNCSQAQVENKLLIAIKFKIENGSLDNSIITLKKNEINIQSYTNTSRINLALDLNSEYLLIFSKPGYITKKVAVSTLIPKGRELEEFIPITNEINLFKNYTDINIDFFNQPISKISLSTKTNEFEYDTDYTASISEELNSIMRKILEKQNEEKTKKSTSNDDEIFKYKQPSETNLLTKTITHIDAPIEQRNKANENNFILDLFEPGNDKGVTVMYRYNYKTKQLKYYDLKIENNIDTTFKLNGWQNKLGARDTMLFNDFEDSDGKMNQQQLHINSKDEIYGIELSESNGQYKNAIYQFIPDLNKLVIKEIFSSAKRQYGVFNDCAIIDKNDNFQVLFNISNSDAYNNAFRIGANYAGPREVLTSSIISYNKNKFNSKPLKFKGDNIQLLGYYTYDFNFKNNTIYYYIYNDLLNQSPCIFEYNLKNNSAKILKQNFNYNYDDNIVKKLIVLNDGNLFGITNFNGLFTFNLKTNEYSTLNSNGTSKLYGIYKPSLVETKKGTIFGTTEHSYKDMESDITEFVFFEFDRKTNTLTEKFIFNSEKGNFPSNSLIEAKNGKLYGTTYSGGKYGGGTLYEYDIEKNSYTKLIDFDAQKNGGLPLGNLIEDKKGNLYGILVIPYLIKY
ncbi:MAG: choice-of-anchor tandem repeat GloVer-containing protein [Bacteroidota bacterium]